MIIGIGMDLIELDRIQASVSKGDRLMKRILTDEEQEIYKQYTSERRKVEFLAGRFAAKEAFAKAAGTGIGKLRFRDIEVLRNQAGAPTIKAKGYDDQSIFLSITHSKQYAAAQVVIEE